MDNDDPGFDLEVEDQDAEMTPDGNMDPRHCSGCTLGCDVTHCRHD
ncbi:hypothetical protein [Nocardiopsis potens]|nr:hypothetical protein [Nocardiopsis potens]